MFVRHLESHSFVLKYAELSRQVLRRLLQPQKTRACCANSHVQRRPPSHTKAGSSRSSNPQVESGATVMVRVPERASAKSDAACRTSSLCRDGLVSCRPLVDVAAGGSRAAVFPTRMISKALVKAAMRRIVKLAERVVARVDHRESSASPAGETRLD